ncbi:MAG TPA: FKBP-type peptidyl-prolyl cis-trans isomerase [Solirubrobacteraceae bacterium]|nr:FKBP-type peptidyl-prolyl cis-trans isomerase [Solirubrobacteraceae bacterium]
MPKKTTISLAALALGVAVAGCGGSTSTAAGVQTAPSAGATQGAITTAPASSSSTTTSSSTASTPTPTSGPLSHEPTITPPKGAPPKTVVTKDLVKGTGAVAKSGSTITVNYVGALYNNGKVFDASWKRHQTFTTPLSSSSVIPGWVQGIAGMKVGGRREIIIPPKLGYGSNAQPGIPANSTLVFVVDLLKVG